MNSPSNVTPTQQKIANKIARKNGHGSATIVILGKKNRVLDHIRYGYRKYTTDQYVPNAYLSNFGWKNTYYQNAITTVEIDVS
jgi:hypothetical protein